MGAPIVVVGAGLAGLSCARALADAGRAVRVLERSRGVGGRCATRVVDGQAVDHGPAFLHGSDARFLERAAAVEEPRIEPFPRQIRGNGQPCHPNSFREGETRFAFASGLNALPKSLAQGLDIAKGRCVEKLERTADGFALVFAEGANEQASQLVLACALEQTVSLVKPLSQSLKPLRGTLSLLESMGSSPCLALLAGYPKGRLSLDWDLWYPEGSQILQQLSHDSNKRPQATLDALVIHARPRWSREHFEDDDAKVSQQLREEAARLLGSAALEAAWSQVKRWRYARTQPGTGLSAPILHRFGDGFLGLAGDAFAPGGGVEGAFLSGLALAERILA